MDEERGEGRENDIRDEIFPREPFTLVDLPDRMMESETYKKYVNKYHMVNHEALKNSFPAINVITWGEHRTVHSKIGFNKDPRYKDLAFGSSTLEISGCGVFCVAQALDLPIEKLAEVFTEKDYYCYGKGLWHMALDRLGARECKSIFEIANALRSGKIITIVANGHFRNIVGVTTHPETNKPCFIISDSSKPDETLEIISDTFSNIGHAWVWENVNKNQQ